MRSCPIHVPPPWPTADRPQPRGGYTPADGGGASGFGRLSVGLPERPVAGSKDRDRRSGGERHHGPGLTALESCGVCQRQRDHAVVVKPRRPSIASIDRHRPAYWESLISPKYSSVFCTTPPPRTRRLSTTLQYWASSRFSSAASPSETCPHHRRCHPASARGQVFTTGRFRATKSENP